MKRSLALSTRKRWIVAATLALLGFSSASAQTFTWNNFQGTDATVPVWSTNANWSAAPTFGINTTLVFGSSDLQTTFFDTSLFNPTRNIAYSTGVDGSFTVNGLVFNLDGGGQSLGSRNGNMQLNLGAGTTVGTLRLAVDGSGNAPSITQNGNGSVGIRSFVAGSGVVLEGTQALKIGGTGPGHVELVAAISSGTGATGGITIDFAPSTVHYSNTGASVTLGGTGVTNIFFGDTTLKNGNLAIGSSTALGDSINKLVIESGQNSVRIVGASTIANQVQLKGTLTLAGWDGLGATWGGTFTEVGSQSLAFRYVANTTNTFQNTLGFTGALVSKSMMNGLAGAGGTTITLNSIAGGATHGTLTTTDVQLYAGSILDLNNATANTSRIAAGTNLQMFRSDFRLTSNASVNAAETIATLNNTGMSSFLLTPGAGASASLTITNWNRLSNATAYFAGAGLGNAPASGVAEIKITNNPGGQTPGTTTAGNRDLAVLPYAFGNAVSTGNWASSLVRWDAGTQRIVLLNQNTEYANNINMAYGIGTGGNNGLNYRLSSQTSGINTGGVASLSGNVSLNGLVLDMNNSSAVMGISVRGNANLTMTGPILSTFNNTSFASDVPGVFANQIAVNQLNFGANTGYVHTPSHLWILNPIVGSGGLVKSGQAGNGLTNLTLWGNNSGLSGGLFVNTGSVIFEADNNLGASGGAVTLNSGWGGGLTYQPNVYYGTSTATGLTMNRTLTIGSANGGINVINPNNVLTWAGQITGTGGLAKNGAGTLVLSNASNNFVGDVGVFGNGYLVAANDGALGAASNNVIIQSGFFVAGSGMTSTNRNFLITNLINLAAPGIINNNDLTINGEIVVQHSNGFSTAFTKAGSGILTLTGTNTLNGPVVIGASNNFAVTPSQIPLGGGIRLAGANGAIPFAAPNTAPAFGSGFIINDGAALILDNTAAVNNDRIGTIPIAMNGRSFLQLRGNASADVSERTGRVGGNGTITLVQPNSGGGNRETRFVTTALETGTQGVIFVRGDNLGASSGDRTTFIVTPLNTTTYLPLFNSTVGANTYQVVIGGVAASSSSATGPTDFLEAKVQTVPAPNVNNYSLAALTNYGSLATPGTDVIAQQAGSVFTLTGATTLAGLKVGNAGGVDLNGQTLTMVGTSTILSAGGSNSGIVGGTLAFGASTARIITTDNLTIGSLANPTALTGSSTFVKAGPGTLTLFGTAATTLGSSFTNITEGTLVLGNVNGLGMTTITSGSTGSPTIPNVYGSVNLNRGGTLDLTQLGNTTVRINTVSGAGNINLGDVTLQSGQSSSTFSGNLIGSANSKFIVGLPDADLPGNAFGGGGPAMLGDNSGFLGQWMVLRGTLNFQSELSLGSGTAPIIFGNTGTSNPIGSTTLRYENISNFNKDITVQAGGVAVATLLVGTANSTMSGNLILGRNLGISGSSNTTGMTYITGQISGAGQLQLGTGVFGASGNMGLSGNNTHTGGVLMNTGSAGTVLALGHDNALGTGTLTLASTAGLIRADGGARVIANDINVTATGTSFGTTGVNEITFNGNIRGSVNSAAASVTTLTLNSLSLANTTYNGVISNGSAPSLGITKNGPGVVNINGNNTYTGNTVLNGGTTVIGTNTALGNGGRQAATGIAGTATVASGAVLDLNGQGTINKQMILSGGSLINNSASPVTFSGGTVTSLTLTATGGTTISAVPTVTLSGGGGTGATAVATLGLTSASFAVSAGGGGYSAAPTATITGGGGSGAKATVSMGLTSATFTVTNGGSGYTSAPTVTIGGGGGTGATATSTINGSGQVTSITVTTPGNNFTYQPVVTFSGGGGTGAQAFANPNNFRITGITVTDWGSGYSSAPTISFTGGGGSGAAATGNATNFALGVAVTNSGSGYTSAPTVGFSSGTAAATANVSSLAITANSVAGGAGDITVNSVVSGSGNLEKIGAGKLLINSTTGGYTGVVTIHNGTFGGNNTTGGVVTANNTAVISPGNSAGKMTMTTLNTTAGGTFVMELDTSTTPGVTFDQIQVTGTASLGTTSVLQLVAPVLTDAGSQTYLIMIRGAGSSGTFAALNEGDTIVTGPNAYRISYVGLNYSTGSLASGADNNDIVLTSVPEPLTLSLIGSTIAGALGGAFWWRRRSQKMLEKQIG